MTRCWTVLEEFVRTEELALRVTDIARGGDEDLRMTSGSRPADQRPGQGTKRQRLASGPGDRHRLGSGRRLRSESSSGPAGATKGSRRR